MCPLVVFTQARLSSHKPVASHRLLHRAAQLGNEPAVRLLLKAGSPLDPYTAFRETPLHLAVRNNQLACVQALVEAGASLLPLTSFSTSPYLLL